jgi:hypothetical protein
MIDWDDVYAGWQSQELQYYWRKHQLEFQEFDWSMLEVRPD